MSYNCSTSFNPEGSQISSVSNPNYYYGSSPMPSYSENYEPVVISPKELESIHSSRPRQLVKECIYDRETKKVTLYQPCNQNFQFTAPYPTGNRYASSNVQTYEPPPPICHDYKQQQSFPPMSHGSSCINISTPQCNHRTAVHFDLPLYRTQSNTNLCPLATSRSCTSLHFPSTNNLTSFCGSVHNIHCPISRFSSAPSVASNFQRFENYAYTMKENNFISPHPSVRSYPYKVCCNHSYLPPRATTSPCVPHRYCTCIRSSQRFPCTNIPIYIERPPHSPIFNSSSGHFLSKRDRHEREKRIKALQKKQKKNQNIVSSSAGFIVETARKLRRTLLHLADQRKQVAY